jgi:hypothetical protein
VLRGNAPPRSEQTARSPTTADHRQPNPYFFGATRFPMRRCLRAFCACDLPRLRHAASKDAEPTLATKRHEPGSVSVSDRDSTQSPSRSLLAVTSTRTSRLTSRPTALSLPLSVAPTRHSATPPRASSGRLGRGRAPPRDHGMRVPHRLAPGHNPACRVAHRTSDGWRVADHDPVTAPATAKVEALPLATDGVSETADPLRRTDNTVRREAPPATDR